MRLRTIVGLLAVAMAVALAVVAPPAGAQDDGGEQTSCASAGRRTRGR